MDQVLSKAISGLETSTDLSTVQEIVRTTARRVANADGATFVLRDIDQCFYADEDSISPLWKGQRFPLTNCISGWAMLNAQTVAIPDIFDDERIPMEAYRPTFVKSLAMVPVGREKPIAAIGAYWARNHQATGEEIGALEQLADAAAAAIERIGVFDAAYLPSFQADVGVGLVDPVDRIAGGLALGEDRERIARDLHDTVLQRMFAAGLRLQRIMGAVDTLQANEVGEVVELIDTCIRELRGVIFGLQFGHEQMSGFRGEILAVAAEASRVLRFSPEVDFEGDVDSVPEALRFDIVGALREMLSNVARHAKASKVRVGCTAGARFDLVVADDGSGVAPERTRGSGLGNLETRASALGGIFTLEPGPAGGTVARWRIPIR